MGQWIILGIIVILVIYVMSVYNRLVQFRQRVKNAWAQIDVQLRRRYDLIPNLVNTVKGYMTHERETFEAVTEARTRAMAGGGSLADQAQAENALSGTLKTLFAVAENYPQLKADSNFRQLQEELSNTESKIAFSRQFYNDTVQRYNTYTEMFPSNLIANAMGFMPVDYFNLDAEPAARGPVNVDFK